MRPFDRARARTAAAVGVSVALLAGVGVAIGIAATNRPSTPAAHASGTTVPAGASTGAAAGGAAGGGDTPAQSTARPHIRGRITAIGLNTWTVRAQGQDYTVYFTKRTRYGQAKDPASAATNFVVGDEVLVFGDPQSATIVALRVMLARNQPGAATTTTPTSP